MTPLALSACTAVSAMGRGLDATRRALRSRRTGLRPCDFADVSLETHIGRVDGLEEMPLPEALTPYDCRNNRLASLALSTDGFASAVAAAAERHGRDRVAVIVGSSTSGILQSEDAYRRRDPATGALPADFDYEHTHDMFSAARFVRRALGLAGPAVTLSTACASSAKAFADAQQFIAAGLCDAAVVGGVDTLCRMTLHGFASLELLSTRPCRPFDADRDGISIGEAAAFALLEPVAGTEGVALLGCGASSDAYHMSSPHPEGLGAASAMAEALRRAESQPGDIDYVNFHGTGTKANDAMEDKAVARIFGRATPGSSTKGWSGHTLGAAGALEAVISAICIEDGFVPAGLHIDAPDPAFASNVLLENEDRRVDRVISNSFGFGGINCSLVFGRAP
jgi:3-oxoacyl-[acyl-carrier-protein] synthase I